MKITKWRYGAALIFALFFIAGSSQAADILGQADSLYRIDFTKSFYATVLNYSSTSWKIDPDSSKIEQCLNDVLLSISYRFKDACQRKDTIVTSSTLWVDPNKDFIDMVWVSVNDPTRKGEIGLTEIAVNEIGMKTSDADTKPTYYAVWGNPPKIYFDANNGSGDTLFLYYQARANKLTADSTITNVTKKYFELAVNETIVKFFQFRDGPKVDRIVALAKDRIAEIYAELNMLPPSIKPEILKP